MPDEGPQREDRSITQYSRPGRGDVEGSDLRTLVRRPKRVPRGIGLAKMQDIVEAVGILEPRASETEIQLD